MQYDRNDEITYDKEFLETTNREYYNPEDYKNNDEFCSEEKVFSEKKEKTTANCYFVSADYMYSSWHFPLLFQNLCT